MKKNTSVALGDHYTSFVNSQLEQGRYGSASEVLRAGLRLLEERELKIQALCSALEAGEQSGLAMNFDIEDFLGELNGPNG